MGRSAKAEKMSQQYRAKRDFIREYKALRGCVVCGEDDPIALDLDHRDPSTKNHRMKSAGQNVPWANLGWAAIHEELPKCDVLCANCHRKRHYRERR